MFPPLQEIKDSLQDKNSLWEQLEARPGVDLIAEMLISNLETYWSAKRVQGCIGTSEAEPRIHAGRQPLNHCSRDLSRPVQGP